MSLLPSSMLHVTGRPLAMVLIMFRAGVPPNMVCSRAPLTSPLPEFCVSAATFALGEPPTPANTRTAAKIEPVIANANQRLRLGRDDILNPLGLNLLNFILLLVRRHANIGVKNVCSR